MFPTQNTGDIQSTSTSTLLMTAKRKALQKYEGPLVLPLLLAIIAGIIFVVLMMCWPFLFYFVLILGARSSCL